MFNSFEEARQKNPKSFEYVHENLVPFVKCARCGAHVLKSELVEESYKYQCMYCNEDLFDFEVAKDNRDEISDYDFLDLVHQTNQVLELDKEEKR